MESEELVENDWEFVAEVQIESKKVAVVDPMSWDSVPVEIAPGLYVARIRTVQFEDEDEVRVARVQFTRKGTHGVLGDKIGKIGVDASTIGILDQRALDPELAEQTKEYEEELNESWQSGETSGVVKWGPEDDDEMVYVTTGFGDGSYTIRELVEKKVRVGLEIEFIDPKKPRPV